MPRPLLLILPLLAFVATACGSDGDASASPNAPSQAATPAATPEPTEEPTDDPLGSGFAIPSFEIDGDPELAARFPETVGGQPLQVQSIAGDAFAALGGFDPSYDRFLESLDADLEDVSVAFGGLMSAETTFSVGAFRVLGSNADELQEEFIGTAGPAVAGTDYENAVVGGKDVLTVTAAAAGGVTFFVYAQDDTIYYITGSEDLAAEVLEALP